MLLLPLVLLAALSFDCFPVKVFARALAGIDLDSAGDGFKAQRRIILLSVKSDFRVLRGRFYFFLLARRRLLRRKSNSGCLGAADLLICCFLCCWVVVDFCSSGSAKASRWAFPVLSAPWITRRLRLARVLVLANRSSVCWTQRWWRVEICGVALRRCRLWLWCCNAFSLRFSWCLLHGASSGQHRWSLSICFLRCCSFFICARWSIVNGFNALDMVKIIGFGSQSLSLVLSVVVFIWYVIRLLLINDTIWSINASQCHVWWFVVVWSLTLFAGLRAIPV